jgi:MFS family permease
METSTENKNSWVINLKAWGYRVFLRDYNIRPPELAELMIQALVFATTLTFFITAINKGYPNGYSFSFEDQIFFYALGAACILLGGLLVDLLVRKPYVFTTLILITIGLMLLCLYTPAGIHIYIATCLICVAAFTSCIIFFTRVLNRTTLLNRARIFSLVIFLTILLTTPVIYLINTTETFNWTWGILVCLVILHVILVRNFEDEILFGHIRQKEILSIANYFRLIHESGIGPYFFFLFFVTAVMGFFISNIFGNVEGTLEISVVIFVGLISFPLIGAILDHIGRKPITILTVVIAGILSIYFDYPTFNPEFNPVFNILKIILFVFTALLILILTGVIAGDVSSRFSRGRVVSTALFASIAGAVLGTLVHNNLVTGQDFVVLEQRVRLSDTLALLCFLALAFIGRARESLQEDTQEWRTYLDRIFLISRTGLGLYAHDFTRPNLQPNELNEDLVSGGLSGLQMMIKEISNTDRSIDMLDQGDKKLIFHEGKYSTAVLFVRKDLAILRDKLALFHDLCEYYNQDVLEHFYGNISNLQLIVELKNRFFN